jgi:hypothetical protein
MPDIKSEVGIKEQLHIVLIGPDGKIKEERKSKEPEITEEHRNGNKE